MSTPTRRRFVLATGALSVGALAGCTGTDDGGEDPTEAGMLTDPAMTEDDMTTDEMTVPMTAAGMPNGTDGMMTDAGMTEGDEMTGTAMNRTMPEAGTTTDGGMAGTPTAGELTATETATNDGMG